MRIATPGRAAFVWCCLAALPIAAAAQYDMGLINSRYGRCPGHAGQSRGRARIPNMHSMRMCFRPSVLFDNTYLYIPKGCGCRPLVFKSIIDGIIHTDKFRDQLQPGAAG